MGKCTPNRGTRGTRFWRRLLNHALSSLKWTKYHSIFPISIIIPIMWPAVTLSDPPNLALFQTIFHPSSKRILFHYCNTPRWDSNYTNTSRELIHLWLIETSIHICTQSGVLGVQNQSSVQKEKFTTAVDKTRKYSSFKVMLKSSRIYFYVKCYTIYYLQTIHI